MEFEITTEMKVASLLSEYVITLKTGADYTETTVDMAKRIAKIISPNPVLSDEGCDTNPYLLTGEELKRTEDARKAGKP